MPAMLNASSDPLTLCPQSSLEGVHNNPLFAAFCLRGHQIFMNIH